MHTHIHTHTIAHVHTCSNTHACIYTQSHSPTHMHTRTCTHTLLLLCTCTQKVLRGCDADVWVTGEMSHHDLLAANADGVSVVLAEHSNSERGFLPHVAQRLTDAVDGVVCTVSASDADPVLIV